MQPYAKYLDTRRAAELLGLSEWTLIKWRQLGTGPRFQRLGRLVKYEVGDLSDFASQNAVEPER